MKKLLVGLLALASVSSFAANESMSYEQITVVEVGCQLDFTVPGISYVDDDHKSGKKLFIDNLPYVTSATELGATNKLVKLCLNTGYSKRTYRLTNSSEGRILDNQERAIHNLRLCRDYIRMYSECEEQKIIKD